MGIKRLYNARIMTLESKECDVFFGEIWIKEDRIAKVISYGSDIKEGLLSANKDASLNLAGLGGVGQTLEQIDCMGNLLMPGFKNAHTHSAMTLMRSYADDMALQEWLFEKIFPLEAKMSGEDIYTFTKLAILEYLTSGVTSIFEMYMKPEFVEKACIDMGMRLVQVGSINRFGPSLEVFEEEYSRFNGKNPLSSYILGFHAEYTCDKKLLEDISQIAHKYNAPVYTHNAETKREVDECMGRYNLTPTQLLDSLGMFDFGGGGYHCVHLTNEDMDIFKKRGMYIVTNPGSNTKLASGIAPVSKFLSKGIPVAIGTDGPSSNNCLDMFREMFLVTGLAKLRDNDPPAVPAQEVLHMASVNGAKAMGLCDCDIIAEKKRADIIMIDLNQPNMRPLYNIAKNLVYSGTKSNVIMTMINGQILYKDGCYANGINAAEIIRECDKACERLGTN